MNNENMNEVEEVKSFAELGKILQVESELETKKPESETEKNVVYDTVMNNENMNEVEAKNVNVEAELSEDELRRQRRNEASRRCYAKMRAKMIAAGLVSEAKPKLTDEERRQHRNESSKRCREKQRLADAMLGIAHEPRVKLSDEERRLRRNASSLKCYYAKKAARLAAIAALEAEATKPEQ